LLKSMLLKSSGAARATILLPGSLRCKQPHTATEQQMQMMVCRDGGLQWTKCTAVAEYRRLFLLVAMHTCCKQLC
jgi:hypothetical protein